MFCYLAAKIEKLNAVCSGKYSKDDKSRYVSQHGHIRELYKRPAPSLGFAIHYSERAHTLHGEGIEHEQRETHRGCKARAAGFGVDLLAHACLYGVIGIIIFFCCVAYAVYRGDGTYEHFARGK